MKSYKQFVTESNQSREIFENAILKGILNVLRGGSRAGAFTSAFNTAALGHAGYRGVESALQGDKTGVYNAAAMALPATNPYSTTFKLGAMGIDLLRQREKAERDRKKLDNKVTGK